MNSGIDSLHKILKDETRKKILLLLRDKKNLSYTDLMEALEITSTGKLNYHLKVLGDLLSKADNGGYVLTEKGALASRLLLEFPGNVTNHLRLSASDTLLIGLAGFLLVFVNPFLWGILGGVLIVAYVGLVAYAMFVPAWLMWRLAANRTKSHDLFELFKPAIVPALLLTLVFILLFVRNQSTVGLIPFFFVLLGFAPFLGIAVIEALHRIINRQ